MYKSKEIPAKGLISLHSLRVITRRAKSETFISLENRVFTPAVSYAVLGPVYAVAHPVRKLVKLHRTGETLEDNTEFIE